MKIMVQEKVLKLMAEYFLHSQESQCLLCDNYMKNITIKKDSPQGCDGNCTHNKEYTADDLIKLFEKEAEYEETEVEEDGF